MTDEFASPIKGGLSDRSDQPGKIYSDNKDWLLEQIVNMVDYTGVQIGITINLSGSIVSGVAISARTYIHGITDRLEAENPSAGTNSPTFSSVIADALRSFEPSMPPFEQAKGGFLQENPNYLHLRNAETFIGGGTVIPSHSATYFRCRISEISGFSLGALTRDDELG